MMQEKERKKAFDRADFFFLICESGGSRISLVIKGNKGNKSNKLR